MQLMPGAAPPGCRGCAGGGSEWRGAVARTLVPERAMVPRFSTSSLRVMPIPVSSRVSVLPATEARE